METDVNTYLLALMKCYEKCDLALCTPPLIVYVLSLYVMIFLL